MACRNVSLSRRIVVIKTAAECYSTIRSFYTFAGELWKATAFQRIAFSTRTRAQYNCKIFHFIRPRYFPWKNPILHTIISLYPAITRFSQKIRIKTFSARGSLLFSYRDNPRRLTLHAHCTSLGARVTSVCFRSSPVTLSWTHFREDARHVDLRGNTR